MRYKAGGAMTTSDYILEKIQYTNYFGPRRKGRGVFYLCSGPRQHL